MSSKHNSVANERLDASEQDQLIVCLAGAMRETALLDVLEQDPTVAEIVSNLRLAATLQAQPAQRALIVYDRPVSYLCQCMADGAPPIEALNEWKAAAAALLDVLRLYRDRIWLVDLDMIAQYPTIFVDRLQLSPTTASALKIDRQPVQNSVLRMLGGTIVRQEMSAHTLAGELEASAINLSNHDRPTVWDGMQAFEHYTQQLTALETQKAESVAQALYAEEMFAQLEVAQAETAALKAERAVLMKQLDQAQLDQAETTALKAELEEQHIALEQMQQRQIEMDSKLARAADDGAVLKAERAVLMKQLDQAQLDLEAHYGQIRAQSSKLEAERRRYDVLAQQKAEVDNWIHGIQASITYRMMNPLRRLRRLLK